MKNALLYPLQKLSCGAWAVVGAGAGGTSGQKWQEPGGGWDTRLSLSDVTSPTPHPRRLVFLESIFYSRVVAQGHRGPAQLARCDSGLCGAKGPKITPGHPPQFLLHTEEMWCLRLVRGKDTLHAETEDAGKWRQQRQTGVLRQRCFPSPTELSPERAGRKPLWQVPRTSAH